MKVTIALLCSLLFFTAGYGQVKSCSEIEEWDGLFYNGRDEAPYSGVCYDYYDNGDLKTKASYFDGVLENSREIRCDAFGNCKKIFQENFSNNINNWLITDEPSVSSKVEKGQLRIQIRDSQAFSRLIELEINTDRNFSIETTMHVTNDDDPRNGQGLVFGFRNWDNYNSFEVNGNGAFIVRGKHDGIISEEKKWTTPKSLYIDAKSNTLKVSKVGNNLHYSVNGFVVHSDKFEHWDGIYVGFLARGRKELALDNLIVMEDIDLEDPMLSKEDLKMIKRTLWTNNGPGFVLSADGLIVTSHELVKGMDEIEVNFTENDVVKAYKADLLISDKENNIAILKIKDENFKPFQRIPYYLKTDVCEVFEKAISMSYPMGDAMDMEMAVVDAQIIANGVYEGQQTLYETSKPLDPSYTGGPVFDGAGNLIGVANGQIKNKENGGYALKAKYISLLVAQLPRQPVLPKSNELASKSPQQQLDVLRDYVALVTVR